LACAGAVAVILALAGCSGLSSSGAAISNAQSSGKLIGASALHSSATATTAPSTDYYSMNSHWKNVAGCPKDAVSGFTAGLGAAGTVAQTTPTTTSGPLSLPTLTAAYVPSCAFAFTDNGVPGRAEIFIGMGDAYATSFTNSVLAAGFSVYTPPTGANPYGTYYLKGGSLIGIAYEPVGTGGYAYSIVSVVSYH